MNTSVTELYDPREVSVLEQKIRKWKWIAIAISLATLLGCILICLQVRLSNARQLLLWCILLSLFGGWTVLTIRIFVIAENRNILKHIRTILEAEKETVAGEFTLTEEKTRIKNGVAMRLVTVQGPDGSKKLYLYEAKTKLFDADNAASVSYAYGFITAYGKRQKQ